jgi:peptide/nickel transport system substrate-binding protein
MARPSEEERMGLIRKPAHWLLLLVALSMLAAACGGGGGGGSEAASEGGAASETGAASEGADAGQAVEGGSVVFGADQQPDIMNPTLTAGNLFATTVITMPLLEGAYQLLPDFTYQPQLIDGEAKTTQDPFTVTYTIKDEAQWSDGEPITAQDFIFTWKTYVNEKWDITSRDGYDQITDGEAMDDKTVRFTFEKPFAPYKVLFSPILPQHELQGKNFNQVWNDEVTLSSGPFEFDSWQKGQQATIKRNENYYGEPAKLDEISFRFLEDSNTQVQSLQGEEIDMMYPQPQIDLVEQVSEIEGVKTETAAGTVWEHLDFNFVVPPLDQLFVRQAIAHGIDREALAEQLIKPINPEAVPLQNLIYVNNQAEYEPHFDQYNYDPDRARQLLEENGCTEGDGGIYECDGEPLSFRYTTTAGNELRELQLEVIQAQLSEIGIDIKSDIGDAATVFADVLPSGADGAWDLFNFAWVGSPDPFGGNAIWMCEGGQNYNSYCNEEVTDLLRETNTLLDPAERAATYNEADALMADDLPVLPLYQKPTYFAWNERISGPKENPTQAGPTWNAGEWFLTE